MIVRSKCNNCGFYSSGHCSSPFPCPKIPSNEEFNTVKSILIAKNEKLVEEGNKSQLPSMDLLLHRFDI